MKLEAYPIDEQVLVAKEYESADLFRELDEAYQNDADADISDPRLLEPIEVDPEADFHARLAAGSVGSVLLSIPLDYRGDCIL